MNSKKIMKIATVLMIIATILLAFNMVFATSIPTGDSTAVSQIKF